MKVRALSLVLASSLLLLACPSKESSSSSGATSPSGAVGPASGPLAGLESAPFAQEVWTSQEGVQMQFIYYTQQNVRVSGQCRQGASLTCEAVRQLRGGMPVQIPKRELTGNISAGTKVCMKLGHKLVTGHNAMGSEDGFCRFPDGSMVSTGALEQYAMRVIE